ncbi:diguanylate cyclase [Oscillatoria acuminata]|uniref:PAS domain S-box/diguanylate cyclase (GGDEF) domain-containing protein n=1 Tax=Oscillatoria acuminata PCC 6304 TaxID=56110 RepID=K9TRJ5_9CYAN|nr:diguanylate cyclase [Oscillatoria acuminata]AFY85028.1 PAS domain S-box/diguanylate cyclase (GGDEF) domain-containing protein [Oscillatoria acuminata PCC 6304]
MSTLKQIAMQLKDLPISSLSPETTIERKLVTLSPDTPLKEALGLMLPEKAACPLPTGLWGDSRPREETGSLCLLVIEDEQLVGLLTEWDFVRVGAEKNELKDLTVREVMTQNIITIKETEFRDIFSVLKIFRKHKIRHLPLLNETGNVRGLVTLDSIRKVLKPADLLKGKRVEEVMATDIIHIPPTASLLQAAHLIAEYRVASIIVTEKIEPSPDQAEMNSTSFSLPVGVITERDILHFMALEFDLEQIQVGDVMTEPLLCLNHQESVWTAHQQMQRRQVERLVICGNQGELVGIITHGILMQTLDPSQLYGVIHGLEQKVWKLQAEKVELLHNRNIQLEREVNLRTKKLHEQASRERLLNKIALRIRESLNLHEILTTTVSQVRQLLKTDRVIIYQFGPNWSGKVEVESVRDKHLSIFGRTIRDTCFEETALSWYQQGQTKAIDDIYNANLTPCYIQSLEEFQVRANLVVPILQGEDLWGLLIAHHCVDRRKWNLSEIDFLEKLATQVAIAINQSTLFQQAQSELARATRAEAELQKSKDELEIKVQERTAELKAANEQLHREIQERKQAETDLLSSQRFIQRIAETTPNILYIYDLLQEKNVYKNRSIGEILDYTPEQIEEMGENIFQEVLHPDDVAQVTEHFQQRILLKEEEILEMEYRIKDAHDRWRWFISRDMVFSRNAEGLPNQILGTATDITSRKNAEEELQQANVTLKGWVSELELRNQEMDMLGQMNEFLQACLSVDEAYKALDTLLQPLFPGTSGAVFMMNESKNLVEAMATWGDDLPTHTIFSPSDCWALRRGRLHWINRTNPGLACKHIHANKNPAQSLCVQMIAQGETLGMLYLASENERSLTPGKRQLARTVSEQVSLALANLKLRETLHQQSIRDPLTGLFNRRYLEESLNREIHRALRTKRSLAIVMIDVDRFKQFNDTFGHDAGDAVLRELGTFLQTHVRTSDIACRYGGEELTLILPDADLEDAARRAETLRQGIKELKITHRDQTLDQITISMGVAACPDCGTEGNDVMKAADAALYRAKKEGRDRTVVACP